ncbi:hypothetical protein [Ligilactobacillus ruminis]|uniref:hypothetical protein n=1 Tax=Ligilactobacillus ruminis TaxID=1623 RepID=UPI0026581C90|nr:hypothetical protein [Ligilactobacillus ruminis]WKB71031.1 hypothetical protein QYH55_01460 [Ligilactobacillus ruminis]
MDKYLIFVYRTLQNRGAGSESRQKPGEMSDFCLPDSPNPVRAVSKVEQNHPKLKKIFYSVNFAKKVWTQITDTSQKSPFCSQPDSDAVIEHVMRRTEFGKITAVYGHIAENGLFVRKFE